MKPSYEIELSKLDLDVLLDLEKRLIDDYNDEKPFEQHEEDRLVIGKIIDKMVGENYGRNI